MLRGSWLPSGIYWHPVADLRYLLARSAQWHARTALRGFASSDPDDQLQAASSAGTATELLAKAYLAGFSPSLLADKGDRDTVLRLSGHGAQAKGGALAMKTIGAYEALRLVAHLCRTFPPFEQQPPVLVARNAALHTAIVDNDGLRAAVIQMTRMTECLLGELGLDRKQFWGERALPVADSLLDEAARELEQVIASKLAAARSRLDALTGDLPEGTAAIILASLSRAPMTDDFYHEQDQECPVCHQQGILLCDVGDAPFEPAEDHGYNIGTLTLREAWPVEFFCRVCRLELHADELDEFDFPREIPLEPEEGEWDEDTWRDR